MVDGHNVLSNHRFDNPRDSNIIKKNLNRDIYHRIENDKNKDDKKDDVSPPLPFSQMEGKCYCCTKTGHKSPQCHHTSSTKREERAINKTQTTHVQKGVDSSESSVNEKAPEEHNTTKEHHIGWAKVHIKVIREESNVDNSFKNLILLDSDSNTTVFCEKYHVGLVTIIM